LWLCQAANAKHALMDLRFYLEVPWPPSTAEQVPTRSDINLFFKFYDWKVGGVNVDLTAGVAQIG
jgi:hypothetical protein